MKIHEAIAYFKELTEQKGHFEVALEAMKKQIPQKVKNGKV